MPDNVLVTYNEGNGRTYYRELPVSGTKYGELELTGNYKIRNNSTHVEILCTCGNLFYTSWQSIKIGKAKSCGCKTNEFKALASFKHGLSRRGAKNRHPIYNHWATAKSRCFGVNNDNYPEYGGRGITMCKEWADDFTVFYDWAINNGWEEGLTLDRHPNNETGNYEPSNCRWATDAMQTRNTRQNVIITAWGETKVQVDWVNDERCAVSVKTLRKRLKQGWIPEDALTKKRA